MAISKEDTLSCSTYGFILLRLPYNNCGFKFLLHYYWKFVTKSFRMDKKFIILQLEVLYLWKKTLARLFFDTPTQPTNTELTKIWNDCKHLTWKFFSVNFLTPSSQQIFSLSCMDNFFNVSRSLQPKDTSDLQQSKN